MMHESLAIAESEADPFNAEDVESIKDLIERTMGPQLAKAEKAEREADQATNEVVRGAASQAGKASPRKKKTGKKLKAK